MKYNILINQKAVCDAGLIGQVDLVDLALFDFIYNFFNSDFENKITFCKDGVQYVEVTAALVNSQMPLIQMSKRTFYNRMNRLVAIGLIRRYQGNQLENRSAFQKGERWEKFQSYFSPEIPMKQIADPMKQNSEGYEMNCRGPMKRIADNNNIEDNNIIYNRDSAPQKKVITDLNSDNNIVIIENSAPQNAPQSALPNKNIRNNISLSTACAYENLSLENCYAEITRNRTWKETATINMRMSGYPNFNLDDFEKYLIAFFRKLQNEGETEKSPKDAMSHFARWLKIELEHESKNNRTNPTKQDANDAAMQQLIDYYTKANGNSGLSS